MRFWLAFLGEAGMSAEQKAAVPVRRAAGEAALDVMEEHLATRAFFVGEALTLADIALYAYTHVAADGGFDLSRWPAIEAWIARVAATPGYLSIGA